METDSLTQAWAQALDSISTTELGPAATNYLHQAKPLGNIEGTILLSVPNDFTKSWLENRASNELTAALSATLGRTIRIAITVDPTLAAQTDESNDSVDSDTSNLAKATPSRSEDLGHDSTDQADLDNPSSQEGSSAPSAAEVASPSSMRTPKMGAPTLMTSPNSSATHLNAKYTFDTFVIGPSNRFAHAAAFAVSETPGTAFNPLFIYGDSGLGKTHLLHAIGHYALSLYPHLKVRYVNSEEFTNEFINAIRLNKTDNSQVEAFHRRYRELDVLLIDDIQFIGDKEQTVEGFFHTFNALYEGDKQIVLTSDVAPNKLNGFEDRMRSRFASGLLVDVQPPDLETRIAILQKKAATDSLEVSPEVLEYIASRISSNIRELEGALLRVVAFANLSQERIDLPLAEMMLKDFVSDPNDHEITVPLIMGQCAHYFGVTIEQMSSSDRSHDVVEARQIAMYLCRELTDLSLPKIGSAFDRDHTTVMHANKKITSLMKEKRETFNHVTELTNRIKQKARES
ncbi:chromosomal replication initiator protein DnaA [Schaalia vaccimaxillae]|uniref:chromosomal replication initiator protein DnaA n=1 Tax=Schaalia vaccimaxillae TaxID=183916 RepID=UPI0003B4F5BA|nr:chromosomal replication initiator protein DnaA [Schaalia vaccimaxillae]